LIISQYQKVTFSPVVRTGACCNEAGEHSFLSNPGEYTFFTFTLKNYAEVTFEKDPDTLKNIEFVELELQYGSKVIGESLDISANEIKLHPGSTLTLKGYDAETGPGKGNMVCYIHETRYIHVYTHATSADQGGTSVLPDHGLRYSLFNQYIF
jgi:hypothetical protein